MLLCVYGSPHNSFFILGMQYPFIFTFLLLTFCNLVYWHLEYLSGLFRKAQPFSLLPTLCPNSALKVVSPPLQRIAECLQQ